MNSFAIPLIEKKVGALFKDLSKLTHSKRGEGAKLFLIEVHLDRRGMYVPNLSFKTLSFVY